MSSLSEKVALVTGGSSGIGASLGAVSQLRHRDARDAEVVGTGRLHASPRPLAPAQHRDDHAGVEQPVHGSSSRTSRRLPPSGGTSGYSNSRVSSRSRSQ